MSQTKTKEYQFEALHEIYFYDAWRSQPELGAKGSSLHPPPRPGLLEAGCCWRQEHAAAANGASAPSPKRVGGVLEEISLTDEDLEDRAGSARPSLVPSPMNTDQEIDAPISVSSAEDEQAGSPTEETVPIASESEEEPVEEEKEEEEEEEAEAEAEAEEEEEEEEEEDMGEDVIHVGLDPTASAENEAGAKVATAPTDVGTAGDNPVPNAPHVQQELREGKAPASPTEPANPLDSPAPYRPSDALVPDPSHATIKTLLLRRYGRGYGDTCGDERAE